MSDSNKSYQVFDTITWQQKLEDYNKTAENLSEKKETYFKAERQICEINNACINECSIRVKNRDLDRGDFIRIIVNNFVKAIGGIENKALLQTIDSRLFRTWTDLMSNGINSHRYITFWLDKKNVKNKIKSENYSVYSKFVEWYKTGIVQND